MRHQRYLSALIAITLIGTPAVALAQGAGMGVGTTPGTGTVPPVGTPNTGAGITAAPGGPSTTTTGMGTGTRTNTTINQPGAPNMSTPGSMGTGATPSGLPGDDPAHPGFPARVGHH
jgi:hypothetical protein